MNYKTYIDNRGYRRYTDTDKLVHRNVAEKKLGRALKKGEVVHHKDRNKLNNAPDNLWVFKNQEEHDRIHKWDAIRFGKKASYLGFEKRDESGCMVTLTIGLIIITAAYIILY